MSSLGKVYSDMSTFKKAVIIGVPIALAGGIIYTKYRGNQTDNRKQAAKDKQDEEDTPIMNEAMMNVVCT